MEVVDVYVSVAADFCQWQQNIGLVTGQQSDFNVCPLGLAFAAGRWNWIWGYYDSQIVNWQRHSFTATVVINIHGKRLVISIESSFQF